MNVSLINVGDELVSFKTNEINSLCSGKLFIQYGHNVVANYTVGDNFEVLQATLLTCKTFSDIIIIGGGLGPTLDDITRNIVAKTFDLELVQSKEIVAKLQGFLQQDFSSNNYRQSYIFKDSEVLINELGTADGIKVVIDKTVLFLFPGVVREYHFMCDKYLVAYLNEISTHPVLTQKLRLFGTGESTIDSLVAPIIKQNLVNYGIYAMHPLIDIELSKVITNQQDTEMFNDVYKKICTVLDDYYYSNSEELSTVVVNLLKNHNLTISVAESCSGGMLSSLFVDNDGVSNSYLGGIISYANSVKINTLHVNEKTLQAYGAVSKEVAFAMANNVKEQMQTDIAISITGIAGPSGATTTKPVGLIYMCIIFKDQVYDYKFNLKGMRNKIRTSISYHALFNLYKLLKSQQ